MVWSAEGNAPNLEAMFAMVVDVIREWRISGRITTTAGVKSALQQKIPEGFDEKDFGFLDFRAFIEAGQAAGHFRLQRLPSGHWVMLLPSETIDDALEAKRAREVRKTQEAREVPSGTRGNMPSPVTPTAPPTEAQRLRADVWSAFVNWQASHKRLWDRDVRRAFVYPVNEEGRPSWESDSPRFAEIEPADEHVQIDWMRQWAATLPSPDREIITGALSDNAPRGEFRRQLSSLGRLSDWRAELQSRVMDYVSGWASQKDVNVNELIEHRVRSRVQERVPVSPKSLGRSESAAQTDTARLRARLHQVIDAMPLSELAALEIPAQYLLLDTE